MYFKKFNYLSIIIILIFCGSFLRVYNINYDDFWFDEMVSFWLSDPKIKFEETIERIFSSNLMISYELFLKFYHYLLSYDVYTSRYFSALISILSLILFCNLLHKNSSKNSVILGLFLLVINIYHIKYSLELRSYIFTFFLALVLINIIFTNKKLKEIYRFPDYLLIFFISLVMLFSHAFSIIIIFSLIFYLLINFILINLDKKKQIYLILTLILSSFIFLFIYLNNISHYPNWVEQVKPSFYSNYYFSKFFGSRILGLIYLILLIFLIIKFRASLLKSIDIYTFFLILLFNSYFLPLAFGYIFKPILVDRYIFFTLIPILALISNFVFLIEKKIFKYSLLFILCIFTFLNHLLQEYTFRQFYTEIYPTKPEVKKVLKKINTSNINSYTFNMNEDNDININFVRKNYLNSYSLKFNYDINFFDYLENNIFPEKFWIIYFTDITNQPFKIPQKLEEYNVDQANKYNRIEIYLLKKSS